jgi:hypothetical protein
MAQMAKIVYFEDRYLCFAKPNQTYKINGEVVALYTIINDVFTFTA